jgi:pimeloyl-ACP methyl ester carboxylesterase
MCAEMTAAVALDVSERGSGEPLLLLHGWPQHRGAWARVAPRLAERYRVITPDLRGLGRSPLAPDEDYRKHALLADVLALLDAQGIERCAVVGHDWGGWLAWLLAIERPERVRRVVTLDIPAPWRGELTPRRIAAALAFGSYQYFLASPWLGERTLRRSPEFIKRFIPASAARRVWTERELEDFARVLQEPGRARASVLYYRQFLLRELPRLVRGTYTGAQVGAPVLAIFGERSPILRLLGTPPRSERVRVEVLPGVGHYPAEEDPDATLGLIEPYLAEGAPA